MSDSQYEYEGFKSDFNNFKDFVEKGLIDLNKKIDKILDPQTGLIRNVDHLEQAVKRSHERIDENVKDIKKINRTIEGSISEGQKGLKSRIENIENFVNIFRQVIWKVVTPLLALVGIGIIFLIAMFLPKVSKAIEVINKMGP